MDTLSFLLAPFIASLILTGIHAYLGVHVVERGVIFVDLSLAQIAALGTTIAVLYGIEPHGTGAYVVSLIFTFIGAAVFSTIRGHQARIPQEAIIGICYAVAQRRGDSGHEQIGGADRASEGDAGGQHPDRLLVRGRQDGRAVRRHRTVPLHLPQEIPGDLRWIAVKAEADGINTRLWDFLFYASFGFVVTSSVAIAGVLLVFCYLIVPSVGAMLFSHKIGTRLAIGWTMGTVVSAIGVYLSLKIDLPTGATIVCTFALVLIAMALVRSFFMRSAAA